MTIDRFEIIIFWSNEDQAFLVDAPELPGCMAHGDSYETALAAARETMALWQETALAMGRTLPQAHGGRLLFAQPKNATNA